MDDGVADDGIERGIGETCRVGTAHHVFGRIIGGRCPPYMVQMLRIGEDRCDAIGEAGGGDVLAGEREHALGGIDGGDVNVRSPAGEFDRDLGGAGAEVEDTVRSLARPKPPRTN